MKTFFRHITKFLKKRGPLLALMVLLAFVSQDVDLAQAADTAANKTKETTEQSLAFLISIMMKALNVFLWPFLLVLGELMDNDLIIGPGMEDRLLGIWVQVRNLVNIGFVIFLLVIAIYNVLPLGEGEGNLALKTALPKLILGLVLVNFTFLGGKIILDVANVATNAVFALPELVDGYDFSEQREEFAEIICLKVDTETGTVNGVETTATTVSVYSTNPPDDPPPIYTELFCEVAEAVGTGETSDGAAYTYKAGDYSGQLNETMQATYFEDLNANNVGLIMAVNMGALDSLVLLKKEAITNFGDLVINSIFSLVMYFIFACSYVVLGLVLLTRIVVLWVALALSPVIVLFYVIPQLKDALGSGGDVVTKVTKQLMAPVIIGLTLTIGFLMISAMGDFASIASVKANELLNAKYLLTGMDDMESFIIAIATVVIIWTGIFAAASGTYAEFATNAVKGFGEKIGGALAKAPLYATTIPVGLPVDGKQDRVAPMAILGLMDAAVNNFQSRDRVTGGIETLAKHSPLIAKAVGDMNRPEYKSHQTNLNELDKLIAKDKIDLKDLDLLERTLAATARTNGGEKGKELADKLDKLRDRGEDGFKEFARLLNEYKPADAGMKGKEVAYQGLLSRVKQEDWVGTTPGHESQPSKPPADEPEPPKVVQPQTLAELRIQNLTPAQNALSIADLRAISPAQLEQTLINTHGFTQPNAQAVIAALNAPPPTP